MPSVFVIRPFGKKKHASEKYKDSTGEEVVKYRETNFENVHDALIQKAIDEVGLTGETTTKDVMDAGNIRHDMFALILAANLVICDITIPNANVFYELGVRHALRKKGTILIKGQPTADDVPFDLLTDRYLAYSVDTPGNALPDLVRMIRATLEGSRKVDSPVFGMLPELAEANRESVLAVPIEFSEEVQRAVAAGSKGWLRLLAEDVTGRSFESVGLRTIGLKQWKLKDLEAAQKNLEKIRNDYEDDVESCLALANVYERRARPTNDVKLLTSSEQAITRALDNPRATLNQRVEALALRGRNQKTIWRSEFEHLPTPEARHAAANPRLRASYQAYLDAYRKNLNHFWSGLAALQMGRIFLDLTGGPDDMWKGSFKKDREAEEYRAAVESEVACLAVTIKMAVEAAIESVETAEGDRLWAKISEVDLLFATDGADDRVRRLYTELVPPNDPFGWDAIRGQLQLFATLGFRTELAQRVITEVEKKQKVPIRQERVIVFAGHRIDADSETAARFPVDRAEQVKARIRERLAACDKNKVIGFASASPGADILFHEACLELGIESIVCLPVPAGDYAGKYFGDLDDWRNRFLRLRSNRRALELCGQEKLPGWLLQPPKKPPVDLWERGNRWVLNIARTSDAEQITLIALWDRMDDRGPGGTAHMVRLARETGEIEVDIIEPQDVHAESGHSQAPQSSSSAHAPQEAGI